jgi:hypothetical protein
VDGLNLTERNPGCGRVDEPRSEAAKVADKCGYLPFALAMIWDNGGLRLEAYGLATRADPAQADIPSYPYPSLSLDWCQRAGIGNLEDFEPIHIAPYIEQHSGSPATIKRQCPASG